MTYSGWPNPAKGSLAYCCGTTGAGAYGAILGASATGAGFGAYGAAPFTAYGDNLAGFAGWNGAYPYAATGAWGDAYGANFGAYGYHTYPAWGNALAAGGYPYAFDGAYDSAAYGNAYGLGATVFNDGTLLDISSVANPVNALNGFASPVAPAVPYGYAAAYGPANVWY